MENHQMRLSITGSDKKVKIEIDRDSDIFEVMEEVRGLLIAWGYHPTSVIDGCQYIIDEFKEEEDKDHE